MGIVCDGAGSASFGGQGASLICRTMSTAIMQYIASHDALPDENLFEMWIENARDRIFAVSTRRGVLPREFASTFVCIVSNGFKSVVAHIGDGCVVVQDNASGEWSAPTWPDHGEYASTTSFVTDDPQPNLRVSQHNKPIAALALFSDGLERLALDFSQKKPFAGFLESMTKPIANDALFGCNRLMSQALGDFLDSDTINTRTDDDKSLIVAVCK